MTWYETYLLHDCCPVYNLNDIVLNQVCCHREQLDSTSTHKRADLQWPVETEMCWVILCWFNSSRLSLCLCFQLWINDIPSIFNYVIGLQITRVAVIVFSSYCQFSTFYEGLYITIILFNSREFTVVWPGHKYIWSVSL